MLQPSSPLSETVATITLGGGCFWCTEAVYQRLKGVRQVISGYAGGTVLNPTYRQICTGATGHAEVIQISYQPEELSLATLLDVFFTVHDPTTLNRQGADVGTQYRSVIYYSNEAEQAAAQAAIEKANAEEWSGRIVTELSPLPIFYPAEIYHQNYYNDNPEQGYCSIVIAPKIKKFERKFKAQLKE
jgi:methionine-S-sulfoxide reductase